MPFLRRVVPLILIAFAAACSSASNDDETGASESNLDRGDSPPPRGPLTPDASFASGGKLALTGGGHAVSAARRADGGLAVLRNETGGVALTIVAADGSKSSDVVLPGATQLKSGRALAQKDGTIVIGQSGDRYYAMRVNAKGAIDTTFKPDPLDFVASDEAIDGDGRIYLAGTFQNHAAVIRLAPTGGLDPSFAAKGAWIASDDKVAATRIAVASDGVGIVASSSSATSFVRFDSAGVMGHSVVLPRSTGDAGRVALIAHQDGSFTYIGPKDGDPSLHRYAIAASGLIAPGDAIDGDIVDASTATLVSAATSDTGCTVHVGDATASLSAAECASGLDYVALGNGKRALVVNSGAEVYVQVFAN